MSKFNEFMNNLWKCDGKQISALVGNEYHNGVVTNTRYMYGNDIEVTISPTDSTSMDDEYIMYGSELFSGDVFINGVFI